MLHGDLALSPFPAGFRDPAFPLPAAAQAFRPWEVAPGRSGPAPPWASRIGAPTVYVTLGTVFNTESGDLFTGSSRGSRNSRCRSS